MPRSDGHWVFEDYKQRLTTKEWKKMLLAKDDQLIFHSRLRQLKAKRLGAGIVEIFKVPLKD